MRCEKTERERCLSSQILRAHYPDRRKTMDVRNWNAKKTWINDTHCAASRQRLVRTPSWDADTTLRYQTGPPFFEKVNVEVTNHFQSCRKYGPLRMNGEQPCLKYSEYGAKMHIGKRAECNARARSDQVFCDFMTKNTNELKWRVFYR